MTDSAQAADALTREHAAELRHELRTPVNHIVGYAEMLREDVPDGAAAGATPIRPFFTHCVGRIADTSACSRPLGRGEFEVTTPKASREYPRSSDEGPLSSVPLC